MRRVLGDGSGPLMTLEADVEAAESGRGMFMVEREASELGWEGRRGCEIEDGSFFPFENGRSSKDIEGGSA